MKNESGGKFSHLLGKKLKAWGIFFFKKAKRECYFIRKFCIGNHCTPNLEYGRGIFLL